MGNPASAQAYAAIDASGQLPNSLRKTYLWLKELGPSTVGEVNQYAVDVYREPAKGNASISTRFNDLWLIGVVDRLPVRKCTVTKMTVTEWQVNGKVPIKPPNLSWAKWIDSLRKNISWEKKYNQAIEQLALLKEYVAELEATIDSIRNEIKAAARDLIYY